MSFTMVKTKQNPQINVIGQPVTAHNESKVGQMSMTMISEWRYIYDS